MQKLNSVYLLTGSNMGNRKAQLETAASQVDRLIGKISRRSGFYETQAWGKTNQPDFVNQALEVKTALSPKDVLKRVLEIEASMGRVRTEQWAERTIDIDILLYNTFIVKEKDLTIPHPHLHERGFALIPLMEIAPELMHPGMNKMVEELYEVCTDPLEVVLMD